MLIILLLLFATDGARTSDSKPEDAAHMLTHLLSTRTYLAHVHQDLFFKYGLDDNAELLQDQLYSSRCIPIPIEDNEEWPTILSGARFLLESPHYETLLDLCRQTRVAQKHASRMSRLFLQNTLWNTFDQLYLEGIDPSNIGTFDTSRWVMALSEISLTMKYLALSDEDIRTLPTIAPMRRELMGLGQDSAPVVCFSLQDPHSHEVASRYTRSIRVSVYLPAANLSTQRAVEHYIDQLQDLPDGTVCLLEENLVALTQSGNLAITGVPSVIKRYTVNAGERDYAMYRVRPDSNTLDISSVLKVPDDTESWGANNLPNIPNAGLNAPMRAPYRVTCVECHNHTLNVLRPGYTPRLSKFMVLGADENHFQDQRLIESKIESAEARALAVYWTEDVSSRLVDSHVGYKAIASSCFLLLAGLLYLLRYNRKLGPDGIVVPKPAP